MGQKLMIQCTSYAHENQNKRKISNENKSLQDKNSQTNSIYVMQHLFCFQTPFKFVKSIHWLWRCNIWQKRPFPTLLSNKNTKQRGKDCLVMIDNEGNHFENKELCSPVFEFLFCVRAFGK